MKITTPDEAVQIQKKNIARLIVHLKNRVERCIKAALYSKIYVYVGDMPYDAIVEVKKLYYDAGWNSSTLVFTNDVSYKDLPSP